MFSILLSSKQFVLYESDNKHLFLKLSTSSLQLISALDVWILFALNDGLLKQEIFLNLEKEGVITSVIHERYDFVKNLLKTEVGEGTYKQEYAYLPQLPSAKTTPQNNISFDFLGKGIGINTKHLEFTQECHILFSSQPSLNNTEVNFQFSLIENLSAYELHCNGHLLSKISEYKHIMPMLIDFIQIVSYQFSDYLLAIHSAILAKNGKGIMLPGLSGSGKSTLCASLLKQGYSCYSDELALLSRETSKLMPMPLPMAIKTGSWDVMKGYFPDIDSLPIWERLDGRRSKYIALPKADIANLEEVEVTCIVFPHYNAELKTCQLEKITPVNALKGLTDVGYQVKDNLTKNKVEAMLNWIQKTPAYSLSYSNLNDAHKIINRLMA